MEERAFNLGFTAGEMIGSLLIPVGLVALIGFAVYVFVRDRRDARRQNAARAVARRAELRRRT